MIKLFQITEHIKYLGNFKYLKGMEVSDTLAACIIQRSMDFENYVETEKQTLRQMKMIKTLSWFTSLQSHTSAFKSLIHMCNMNQEDQVDENADI